MAEEVKEVADNQGEEEVKSLEGEETKVEESVKETEKGEEQAKEEVEDKKFDFDSFEPEVRKTPQDYIRERRAGRAESSAETEDYGDVSPELAKTLEKIAEKQALKAVEPLQKVFHETADEREITDYLSKSGREDLRKYTPVVKKFMKAYSMPAENAFLLADAKFGNPEERGAEQATQRLAKNSKTKTGGGSFRKPTVSDDELADKIRDMDEKEFAEFDARIKSGKKPK